MVSFKFCPLCRYGLSKRIIDNRKRLVCRKCGWIYYENPLPVAVCVVKNKQGKIFAAKRNINPGLNKWALPGGFVEITETPEKACLRELKEETGLNGKIKRLLGIYVQKNKLYGTLLVIGYEVRVLRDKISLNNELKEAAFFSKQDLPFIPFSSHRDMLEESFNIKD